MRDTHFFTFSPPLRSPLPTGMLALLDFLALPGAKLYVLLTLFFRTVRPILRCALTLSPFRKTSYLALTYQPVYEYAALRLDPPPSPAHAKHEAWPSAQSVSLRTGSQAELCTFHLCEFTMILVLGLLFTLVSIFLALADLCRTPRHPHELPAPHVAEVYTSLTGRPYVVAQWELVTVYQGQTEKHSPCPSDVELNLDLHNEASFESSFDDFNEEQSLSTFFLEGMSPPADPNIQGPFFAQLINEKMIDIYLKMLTDEGYTDFQCRILDFNDSNPLAIVIDLEFSARSGDFDAFMDATLRLKPVKDVPLARTDFLLWDMGGGVFKAVEVLDVAVSTRNHLEEVEDGENVSLDNSDEGFNPPANHFGGSVLRPGSPIDLDTDSDESLVFESEPIFMFGRAGPREPAFTFSADFTDPFDDSSAETSTDSDRCEDSPEETSTDSDELQQGPCSPTRRAGSQVPSMGRGRSSPGLFSLPSTPQTRLFREN
ncbi:hypothetical protein BC835DRAFT_1316923 [Cytidiella melzeri]|nr:hypothetical protein BC835DRAFT_1316923 [Cytidiella melzeri]